MSTAATTTATTSKAASKPKKATNKTTKPKHPAYQVMIEEGIKHFNERSGSSRQALLNYIINNYHIESKQANSGLKNALKSGVKSGAFKQMKGTGAQGSFKLGEGVAKKEPKPRKPAAEKKPVAEKKPAKPKKTAAAASEPKKRGRPAAQAKSPKAKASKASVAKPNAEV